MVMSLIGYGAFTPAAAGATYLLDTISSTPVIAISTRLLRSAYAGQCMRVRRSSDNTEQDIGFTGDALDTTSLASFVGANNGHVVTWYDQSGNGNNVTQSSTGLQPRVVNSGSNETLSSIIAPNFAGSYYLDAPASSATLSGTDYRELFAAFKSSSFSPDLLIVANTVNNSPNFGSNSSGYITVGKQGIANVVLGTGSNQFTTNQSSLYAGFTSNNGANTSGVAANSQSYQTGGGTSFSGTGAIRIGGENGYALNNGPIGEVLIFTQAGAVSGTDRTTIRDSMKTYWSTP
jgi:hypothetical protein